MRVLATKPRALLAAVLAIAAIAASAAPAQAQFGISSFNMSLSSQQAGAHADQSTSVQLTTNALGNPTGTLKDMSVTLPAGLGGDPLAMPRCAMKTFENAACPVTDQVGSLDASLLECYGESQTLSAEAPAGASALEVPDAEAFCPYEPGLRVTIGSGPDAETDEVSAIEWGAGESVIKLATPLEHSHAAGEQVSHTANAVVFPLPLFNLQPLPGHQATFGASLVFATILINVDVANPATGELKATMTDVSTLLGMTGATLNLWGVPAEAKHNAARCIEFLTECGFAGGPSIAFMSNPTACTGAPLQGSVSVSSYEGESASATTTMPPVTGCEQLRLSPYLSVTPDTTERDAPAGYEVDLKVPQNSQPEGLTTPDVKDVSVTLPAGTSLSPAMASGLQSCSEAQFAAEDCPNASKVGTAEIATPFLIEKLKGSVFIGEPSATEKYPLRVAVSTGTTTIKLSGQAEPDPVTGQATVVFENAPQLPFIELKLNIFGGPTAVLANPAACGPAVSTSQITSYGGQLATPSSEFTVDSNDAGGSCPPSPSFAPSFSAGTTSPQAGGFSPLTLTASRADGEPSLSSFSIELAPGLLGMLKSVPVCPEPQAASGTCTSASQVGTATILAGAGPLPLPVSGPIYLTGPYDGAPFGLVVVANASVGPFNLGTAIIRSRIFISPSDLHLTITSDPFPQIMGGIPLRLRTVNVTFNRPDFMFNPSGCSPQTIAGTVDGIGGVSAQVSSPFQVAGCESLPFAPRLSATTQAGASSRGNGASLAVKIVNPAQSAGTMHTAAIELPSQLRPRLAAIQNACLAKNALTPAACPPDSLVGHATVASPVLSTPLSGPIYLVAHGGTALPSLVLQVSGEGITTTLTASLTISSHGPITADFQSLPDMPIGTLELLLPSGPHSMLGAIENVCRKALRMPYKLTDQGGTVLKATAAVAVSGCPKHAAKGAKLSRRRAAKGARRRAGAATHHERAGKATGKAA
jgi:hypothetical protein